MKTEITYKCGHTAEVQLYGKSADRERKIAWYATIDCPDCQARAAAEAAEERGLPELTGSEKQIRWALTIRAESLDRLTAWTTANVTSKDAGLAGRIIAAAKARTASKWWIDHRDDGALTLARAIIAEDGLQPTPPEPEPEPEPEAEPEAAPAGEMKGETTVKTTTKTATKTATKTKLDTPYTSALTRAIKDSAKTGRVHVQTAPDGIYVCNGYLAARLTAAEYDALIRPVTQLDAGNYVIDRGDVTGADPMDIAAAFADGDKGADRDLTPTPVRIATGKKDLTAATYYAADAGLAVGINPNYDAILPVGLPRRGHDAKTPIMIDHGGRALALICPVYLGDKATAAVLAYVKGDPQTDGAAKRIAELEARIAELEAPAPEPVPEPESDRAGLLSRLEALEGVTVTIKGAQTDAPVIWASGDTKPHAEELKALGGKWSTKRSAWWYKG